MSRRAAFRQSDLTRAIRAARKAGLHVVQIGPNGEVYTAEAPRLPSSTEARDASDVVSGRLASVTWLKSK
jgi:hypothetical protein